MTEFFMELLNALRPVKQCRRPKSPAETKDKLMERVEELARQEQRNSVMNVIRTAEEVVREVSEDHHRNGDGR